VPDPTKPRALLNLRCYQEQAFWCEARRYLKLWSRQTGKTTEAAAGALYYNMQKPWNDVIYASASLLIGGELIERQARIWIDLLDKARRQLEDGDDRVKSTLDGLDLAAACDILEHNKLVITVRHSATSHSRTQIIAPNPATARGWTGLVKIDEIDFIRDFDDLYEAMVYIMSSQPTFRLHMCTTLGKDDNSWVFRNCRAPQGMTFEPNRLGHWYRSPEGVLVHRLDAWDAYAAGVKSYDEDSGAELTPEQERERSLDRDGWDRNRGLVFKAGGAAAVTRTSIQSAQQLSRTLFPCVAFEEDWPAAWPAFTATAPRIGISLDLATTTSAKSNPSAITVGEQVGRFIVPRVIGRFHSGDPETTRHALRHAVDNCPARPAFIIIDATSERFFAIDLRNEWAAKGIPVFLFVASETIALSPNDKVTLKTYAGNLLVNALDDGTLPLPGDRWLETDLRSVVREKGLFQNVLDKAGNHGDCFDSIKMLVHGFKRNLGPAEIDAVNVHGVAVGNDDDDPPEVFLLQAKREGGEFRVI
jgi:hypothetical protein